MRRITSRTVAGLGTLALSAAVVGVVPTMAQQTPYPRDPSQSQMPARPIVERRFTATVSGQVTAVDHQSGRLTVDTAEGPVNVRFPAQAVEG